MKPEPLQRSQGLDVLRWLGAVAMIVNHAAYRLMPPEWTTHGVGGAAIFISSSAPVLFFFATGFGVAISRPNSRDLADVAPTVAKAAILILADQFLWWRIGRTWGLDFLGFIGISYLLVTAINLLRRPVVASALLIGLLLALRFAVAPLFKGSLPMSGFVPWLLGQPAQAGVSYPASPWMVYPLLGLIGGSLYRAAGRETLFGFPSIAAAVSLVLAVSALACGLWLAGASFHRWSYVGIGFFISSIAVLGAAILSASGVASAIRVGAIDEALVTLRGPASFALVPTHFFLVDATASLMSIGTPSPMLLCALVALLVIVAIRLSQAIGTVLESKVFRRSKGFLLFAAGLSSAFAALLLSSRGGGGLGLTAFVLGQLCLGPMLSRGAIGRVSQAQSIPSSANLCLGDEIHDNARGKKGVT